jgi:hypothetical protein
MEVSMKKKVGVHRGWFLWISGGCFLIGSLVVGSVAAASAGPPAQTVNQGSPGASPWPVSGTVGIDPTSNQVNATISNFPTAQTVNGTVAVSGTVQTGATSEIITTDQVSIPSLDAKDLVTKVDATAYKEVTVYLSTPNTSLNTQSCIFATTDSNGVSYQVVDGVHVNENLAQTISPAPPNLTVTCHNNESTAVLYSFEIVGRSN